MKKGLEQLYKRVEKHLCEEENLLQVNCLSIVGVSMMIIEAYWLVIVTTLALFRIEEVRWQSI